MTLRWGLGLGLLAVAAAGCDVSVCTNKVDGQCFDGPDSPFDGSVVGLDASTDAGTRTDGAVVPVVDGSVLPQVDGAVADGGLDGGGTPVADAGPALARVEDFCDAEYRTAKTWRDKFEECCPRSADNTAAAADLLARSFFYGADSTGADSVDKCIDGLKASAANLTYVPSAAPACIAAFNAQFSGAPTGCPAAGFDVAALESTIGHAASSLNQIAACREAIVGKIARDAACGNSFECQSGLRCLTITGGTTKSCRPPLDRGAPCNVTSECADNFVCMGLAAGSGGRVCYPKGEPLELNSACFQGGSAGGSTECRSGLICVNDKCAAPQPDVICKP